MRVAAILLSLLCCLSAHADDWASVDIETMQPHAFVQTDLILFRTESLDLEQGAEQVLLDEFHYKTVVAEATSFIDGLNISQAEVVSSAGVGALPGIRRTYVTSNFLHEATTDLLGVEGWAAMWGSAESDAYLTPSKGGLVSGQIIMRCSGKDRLGELDGQPMDSVEGMALRAIAGNTVVQWIYDGATDRWTRSGQVNSVVNGENVITPLPPKIIDEFEWLDSYLQANPIEFQEIVVDEYDEFQTHASINGQGGEFFDVIQNWLAGTYTWCSVDCKVDVIVDGEIQ